jgi:hypothetical protein
MKMKPVALYLLEKEEDEYMYMFLIGFDKKERESK